MILHITAPMSCHPRSRGKVPVQYFIIFQIQTSDYRDTFIAHIRIMLVTGKYFWYIKVMDKLVTFRFSLDRQTNKCLISIAIYTKLNLNCL